MLAHEAQASTGQRTEPAPHVHVTLVTGLARTGQALKGAHHVDAGAQMLGTFGEGRAVPGHMGVGSREQVLDRVEEPAEEPVATFAVAALALILAVATRAVIATGR